jgi:hypothetical protein
MSKYSDQEESSSRSEIKKKSNCQSIPIKMLKLDKFRVLSVPEPQLYAA